MMALCVAFSAFAQGKFLKHKVKQGETIASIAQKYDADKKYLLMLNDFPDNIRLKPGDLVLIRELKPGEVQVMEEKEFFETSSPTVAATSTSAPAKAESNKASSASERATAAPAEARKAERPAAATFAAPTSDPKAGANAQAGDVVNFNGVIYNVSDNGYHVFERGQTLFRLSVIYKTSVDKIKEMNGLSSNNVPVGTKLRVK